MASPDDSAILTVVKPAMSPRWFWAITKVVASSLGPLMRKPVVMLSWVLLGRLIVCVRFCRAMKEETFVLTENAPKFPSFSWRRAIAPLLRPSHFGAYLGAHAIPAHSLFRNRHAKPQINQQHTINNLSYCFCV